MNCKCVIDCSQKSAKIIFTFSSRFIYHLSTRCWIIQDICMQCHGDNFHPNLEKIQRMQKIVQKMPFFRRPSSYVYMLPWKMVNLNFDNFSKNSRHNMAYHVWTFMAFNPNDQGQDHIYVICKIMLPYFVDRCIFSS